ncbi:MAG: (2Fe-2S) ferredoxin domain-containing protein [Oscillatoria sp. PMC 1068.18]|nr:(2Fe-2S) ferredoxin domain-containing protein [Oscillatoria sp. PMC 1076.18]MEC4991563.1 (2Fe-2S) ferredoxin domain-containing protein [Oscillatoria sp. PMC 1068.18]
MTQNDIVRKTVLVCQNRTCRKQGSAKVLTAFQQNSVPDVEVVGCGCLGQCGNGPMVLVLPEKVWYCGVHSQEVQAVVTEHLQGSHPIQAMFCRKIRA